MPVSRATYERVALEDREGMWELWCGELRRKPTMTTEHDNVIEVLEDKLKAQLDRSQFAVRVHPLRLVAPSGSEYIPDVCVLPRDATRRAFAERRRKLSAYEEPLPLVVEVWSPSTGARDRGVKLADYRARRDAEIWYIHPRRRTLTAWRLQPDGTYTETDYSEGVVACVTLPGVTINLEELFEPL